MVIDPLEMWSYNPENEEGVFRHDINLEEVDKFEVRFCFEDRLTDLYH